MHWNIVLLSVEPPQVYLTECLIKMLSHHKPLEQLQCTVASIRQISGTVRDVLNWCFDYDEEEEEDGREECSLTRPFKISQK